MTARDTAGGGNRIGSRLRSADRRLGEGPLPLPAHGTQQASDAGDGALDGFLLAATSSAATRRAGPS